MSDDIVVIGNDVYNVFNYLKKFVDWRIEFIIVLSIEFNCLVNCF